LIHAQNTMDLNNVIIILPFSIKIIGLVIGGNMIISQGSLIIIRLFDDNLIFSYFYNTIKW
jgi:hypothetical protein